jgi:hypothetical protein
MKTGLSLQELAGEITRRAATKEDFIADTRTLAFDREADSLVLNADAGTVGQAGAFRLNDHAHSQIAEHAGIPGMYYARMRHEAPELLGRNIREWFDKHPARRMVRTLDGTARAFLSDRYHRMDDDAFANVVLPAISETPGAEVESCGITALRTTVKFTSPRKTREVQKGDAVQFGVAFSNSEVGAGRLTGRLFAKRLVCLNGMVIEEEQFASSHIGKRHGTTRDLAEVFKLDTIRADGEATILKLRDFTSEILTDSFLDGQVEKMRALTEHKVGDPVGAVERLAKQHSLAQATQNNVLRHLIEGGDLSLWGLANAVTRTAEDESDYDEATKLEVVGGRMLVLPRAEYQRLVAA